MAPGKIDMPEISRFFGIVIAMYYNDHEPAHFHAGHKDEEAAVEIESAIVLASCGLGLRRHERHQI